MAFRRKNRGASRRRSSSSRRGGKTKYSRSYFVSRGGIRL
jgi:hypothetical protein